jgi:hypothetical protein
MSVPPAGPQVPDFFGTPDVVQSSPGQLSGDAGLLSIRPFEQRVGLTRASVAALDDDRDPGLTWHIFLFHVLNSLAPRPLHRVPRALGQGGPGRRRATRPPAAGVPPAPVRVSGRRTGGERARRSCGCTGPPVLNSLVPRPPVLSPSDIQSRQASPATPRARLPGSTSGPLPRINHTCAQQRLVTGHRFLGHQDCCRRRARAAESTLFRIGPASNSSADRACGCPLEHSPWGRAPTTGPLFVAGASLATGV